MARDNIDYSHGDSGTEPPSDHDFQNNQRPDAQNFDWFWSTVINRINGIISEFNRLDSNDDGKVDAADQADNADTVDGEHAGAFADAGHDHNHDELTNVGSSDHHSRYTDSEAVVAVNAQTSLAVDITGDADTVDGEHADAFADAGHDHNSRYYTKSEADSNFVGSHNHDSRYYTESEADSNFAVSGHNHDGRYARLFDGVQHPVFSSVSNVPTLSTGESVVVDGDGLYIEDGN